MTKWCKYCERDLPLDRFGPSAKGRHGRKAICYECRRGRQREQYASDPAHRNRVKEGVFRYLYGLERGEYDQKLAEQDGVCAICEASPLPHQRLAVDHDHRCCAPGSKGCGRCTRGLLCQRCNAMLAFIENDGLLFGAQEYLARWKLDGDR